MNNLQKMGGISALIAALTYIVGFAMVFTVLSDFLLEDLSHAESVQYIVDNEGLLYVWYMILYVVNAIFLTVVVLAIHERLKDGAQALSQIAAAFGLIWAGLVFASGMLILVDIGTIVELHADNPVGAELAWVTLTSVEEGLGGGIEIVGGLWALVLSIAALQLARLPKMLNYLGIIIGIAGILTIIPPIADVAVIFGLGFIVWFIWAGSVMLRSESSPVYATT